jgi:glutathione peroxidase
MKTLNILLTMGLLSLFTSCFTGKNKAVVATETQVKGKTLYDQQIKLIGLEGEHIDLKSFKGKKILIVNTASKCGYTGQYEDLEKLHKQYKEKLVIIGAPCNQFGNQEPGSAEEIGVFCQRNYGVSFLMTEKLDVKGSNQHPLYAWLTQINLNGVSDFEVKWNFNKFLINENGVLTHYFGSGTKPFDADLIGAIN